MIENRDDLTVAMKDRLRGAEKVDEHHDQVDRINALGERVASGCAFCATLRRDGPAGDYCEPRNSAGSTSITLCVPTQRRPSSGAAVRRNVSSVSASD